MFIEVRERQIHAARLKIRYRKARGGLCMSSLANKSLERTSMIYVANILKQREQQYTSELLLVRSHPYGKQGG